MPEYFNFGRDEMSCVPVWVKFPNLPLKCWSPRCLAKIASKLGTPIQSDQLTCNMLRISYARVLVELDLRADLKSSIVINLPNGTTLNQPVIYETLPRFCTLCKVLGHKTGACTPPTKPVVARPGDKQNLPATTTNKDRSVFDRLGPVDGQIGDATNQGKANGQIDPMTTEVAVASGEREIVKSKKARKTSNIPVRGTLAADHVSTIQLSSKAPAAVSSGDTCNPIIVHEKEPAGAATSRIDPNVVSVGIVNNRGQRRSSSCATGNGSGGRVLPSFTII
ncbi:hypothetical protein NC653_033978 [Populus alba x Populus x berolinensis]|uniref:DUF4283 domain-containing protein n=1 Tax=Populus alba x Populus x berolinensis TaxID=444605 RepID=A0AAD6LVC0_9ROSI|nr:hypothetical protein NC653_033978 [Populus alba x Populus x berolinensis]